MFIKFFKYLHEIYKVIAKKNFSQAERARPPTLRRRSEAERERNFLAGKIDAFFRAIILYIKKINLLQNFLKILPGITHFTLSYFLRSAESD